MKKCTYSLRRWVVLLLCVILCMAAAVPVTAATKKGTVSSVTVTNVSSGKLTLTKGKTFQLKVSVKGKGSFSKAVKYASSNSKIVSVTGKGVIKAVSKGTAKITVTSSANKTKKAVVAVTVKIPVTKVTLSKTKATIAKGKTLQLKATVVPANATNKNVTWKSSKTSVATVTAAGKVTAKSAGTATITATAKDGSKKSASCTITVNIPVTKVTLSKTKATVVKGKTLQLKATVTPANATNKNVTWKSSKTSVATVTAAGKVTAKSAGTATITATAKDGSKKSASCSITVKNPDIAVKDVSISCPEKMIVGETANASAVYSPENATKVTLSFEGDNSTVADVSSDGKITAKKNGTVKVIVTAVDSANNKVTDSANITVYTPVESVSLNNASLTMSVGEEEKLEATVLPDTASNKTVTFVSNTPEIASVDAEGTVKALKSGKAEVSVISADGNKTAKCEIEVRNPVRGITLDVPDKIMVGTQVQAVSSLEPADADGVTLVYQSDNREIADVKEDGTVSAIANGTVKVMVNATDRYGNVAYDEKEVFIWTPVSEVNLSESSIVLYEEEEHQLISTVLPEEASQQKVFYSSSDEQVAVVNENGLSKAISEGTAVITALSEDGEHQAACSVEVKKIQTAETVSTQEQLENALKNVNLQQLTISTEEAVSLTIPEGDYSQVSLYVNAPEGHIENHANFKNIVITGIGKSTYVEFAVGNTYLYQAPEGRFVTEPGAVVSSFTIAEGTGSVDLVNHGNIANIMLTSQAQVQISGENENRLNVTAAQSAQNSEISTSITLKVTAEAVITINLRAGSENTMVSVDTQENMPLLKGISEVPVTTRDNGVTETLMAENVEPQTRKVRISGSVIGTDQTGASGTTLYFIPYISGYKDVCRKLSVNSTYEGTYPFSEIYLLGADETGTGSISGVLTNARTNQPLEAGITVRLRNGAENKTGSYIAETVTDEYGSYAFDDLEAGSYTVQVLDLRNDESGYYITEYETLTVGSGRTAEGGFAVRFSSLVDDNQVTFTLTWGNEDSGASSDLDSHLIGPTPDDGTFHTWYSNKSYEYFNGEYENARYDYLDYDDTTWEGPENTTIEKSVDGIYHFYVHDFSNRDKPSSDQMSRSAAVVSVHNSESEIGTYHVPNESGNLWYVCDYDSRTGKLTAVNKMIHYAGDESEIGEDLLEKYRGLLRDCLEQAQPLKELANDETRTMLENARQILENSEDINEVMDSYAKVRDFVNASVNGVRIDYLYGSANLSYYYDSDEIITGDVNLSIQAYDPKLPKDDINIELYDSDSTYEWQTDNNDPEAFMIVVTSKNGLVCRYHVVYSANTTDCSIGNVSAERDGKYLVNNWYTNTLYPEGEDQEIHELYIYGYVFSLPSELVITARNPYAAVSDVTASEISGYNGKVTVSADGSSCDYYIRWNLDDNALDISDVTAENAQGFSMIQSWWSSSFWSWDEELEDDILINYITINTYTQDVINALKITTYLDGTDISEIQQSDRGGYDYMFTVSAADISRKWYVRLNVTDDVFLIYADFAYDENGNYIDLISNTVTEYDENDNPVDKYIEILGPSKTIPEEISFVPNYDDASCGSVEASDRDGYDAKVRVTYSGIEKTWYIRYIRSNEACRINEIDAGLDSQGNALITDWYSTYDWFWDDDIEDDVKVYYAGIYVNDSVIPDTLTIQPKYDDVSVGEITESDRSDFDRMVTLSVDGLSRTWYLRFHLTDNSENVSEDESMGAEPLVETDETVPSEEDVPPAEDVIPEDGTTPVEDAVPEEVNSPTGDTAIEEGTVPTEDAASDGSTLPAEDAAIEEGTAPTEDAASDGSTLPAEDVTSDDSTLPAEDAAPEDSALSAEDAAPEDSALSAEDVASDDSTLPAEDVALEDSALPAEDMAPADNTLPAESATSDDSAFPAEGDVKIEMENVDSEL